MSKEKPPRTDPESFRGATLAVLLGSGLGEVRDRFPVEASVDFTDIPGLGQAEVEGHRGAVSLTTVAGGKCLFIEGRRHYYEGSAEAIHVLMAFVARAGVSELLVTSASGSLDGALPPGRLVRVADVIDLQWRPPLRASARTTLAGRGASPVLDLRLGARLDRAARSAGVPMPRGVMACNMGPAYETPAEVEALGRLGASVVTMSGAPEIASARDFGIAVASVALVTNWATGIAAGPLSHREVLAAAGSAAGSLAKVVDVFIEKTIG